jgi:hypothetical protein
VTMSSPEHCHTSEGLSAPEIRVPPVRSAARGDCGVCAFQDTLYGKCANAECSAIKPRLSSFNIIDLRSSLRHQKDLRAAETCQNACFRGMLRMHAANAADTTSQTSSTSAGWQRPPAWPTTSQCDVLQPRRANALFIYPHSQLQWQVQ